MKRLVDQIRPDRTTVVGHLHGVLFSGKREDAFPSGHALHMGALASAAGALPAGPRRAVRTLAVGLSLTRAAVLAHWASDVAAGFAVGIALERFLRVWTGFPQHRVHAGPDPIGHTAAGRQARAGSTAE
jgi:undecaprenyl-diphosphatase